jgi:hypothetical protein
MGCVWMARWVHWQGVRCVPVCACANEPLVCAPALLSEIQGARTALALLGGQAAGRKEPSRPIVVLLFPIMQCAMEGRLFDCSEIR